jgi:hypothetical protein
MAPSSPPVRDDDMAEVADDFEDDIDEVQDLEDVDDEIDAEDLFGENMMRSSHLHPNTDSQGLPRKRGSGFLRSYKSRRR